MGSVEEFKSLLTEAKGLNQGFAYSKKRSAERASSRDFSPEDLGRLLNNYSIQYCEDTSKEVFYVPLSCMGISTIREGSNLIVNYQIYNKIVARTIQDAIYKGMIVSWDRSSRLCALFVKDLPVFYASKDCIFDSAGDLLFGLFAKCKRTSEYDVTVENIVVRVSPEVFTKHTELNKTIIKYILENSLHEIENVYTWNDIPFDNRSIPETIMYVKKVPIQFIHMDAPPVGFENSNVHKLLLEHIDLFE